MNRANLRRLASSLLRFVPDKLYIDFMYRREFGRSIRWDDPRTFNEKLNWLKLNDHRSQYVRMVDKATAKDYAAETIGGEYIIPTLGVWDSFDAVDFDALPERFVLKCTHDSDSVVLCPDKAAFDKDAARRSLTSCLNHNYFWTGREWPYKQVVPKILAEPYMEAADGSDPPDYKFFCFNGTPRIVLTCTERRSEDGLKEDFFDTEWNHLDMQRAHHGNADVCPGKPKQLATMEALAAKLSKDIPFARIDFYEIDGQIYFGEMTLFPSSGFEGFKPASWDEEMGSWIKLPR